MAQVNDKEQPELTVIAVKDAPQLSDIGLIPVLMMERTSWEETWIINRMRKTCGELVNSIARQ